MKPYKVFRFMRPASTTTSQAASDSNTYLYLVKNHKEGAPTNLYKDEVVFNQLNLASSRPGEFFPSEYVEDITRQEFIEKYFVELI